MSSYEDEERKALRALDAGYTMDPEEHPGEPLVDIESWTSSTLARGYEVLLSFDPDAYFFGTPRRWIFEMHSLDPRFPPSRRDFELLRAIAEECRGETTEFVEREVTRRFSPYLRRRDRLVVRSEDGERELTFDYQKDPVQAVHDPVDQPHANEHPHE